MHCHNCGYKLTGLGCTRSNTKVNDHDSCNFWVNKLAKGTINHIEDMRDQRFDSLAIEQYKQAGYILDLREVI